MISGFQSHFIGNDYGILVEVIDTVSPVKAKPVYIQLSDGDKSMLMQAWSVRYRILFPLQVNSKPAINAGRCTRQM
jgi:hypothetical protein